MNDKNFELEQNLPSRAREIIKKRESQIEAARRRIELLAPRFEASPRLVEFDALSQVAQDDRDAIRTLNSLSTEPQSDPVATDNRSVNGELDLDMIRKQVEAA
jgi:hypothetical protein